MSRYSRGVASAKRADARILRTRGHTIAEIAEMTGSSKTSVVNWCQGIPAPVRRKVFQPERDQYGRYRRSRP